MVRRIVPQTPHDFVVANVRRLRIKKGFKVRSMARRGAIPLGSYSCLETGRYRMSIDVLFRILLILGEPITAVWPKAEPVRTIESGTVAEAIRAAWERTPKAITLEDILKAVRSSYGLSEAEMLERSRRSAEAPDGCGLDRQTDSRPEAGRVGPSARKGHFHPEPFDETGRIRT